MTLTYTQTLFDSLFIMEYDTFLKSGSRMHIIRILLFLPLIITASTALTLNEAIDKTLKTNPLAHSATLRYESTQEDSRNAHSSLYPRIDFNTAYYPTKTYVMPVNGAFSTKQNDGFHADVTGVYSLWDASRTQNRIDAASSARDGALFNKKLTQSELIEQVWLRYYAIAYTDALIVTSQSSVKFYEGQYTQALHMRQSGLKTEADELRFKASLMESNDRLEWAKNESEKAQLALGILTGSDESMGVQKIDLDEKANTITPKNQTLESLRQELRDFNPRLKALQATAQQSKRLSDAASSQRYGEVMLVGSAGYDNSLSSYDSYQAGIIGSIPLYDGGKLSSDAQKSRIAYSIAQKEYESTEHELWQVLYGAYKDLQRTNETIKSKEEVIAATRKTLALFEERYKQGLSTYIDVLESQNTLDNAHVSLAEAKYQKIRAYALMQKLLNQGCDNDVCK